MPRPPIGRCWLRANVCRDRFVCVGTAFFSTTRASRPGRVLALTQPARRLSVFCDLSSGRFWAPRVWLSCTFQFNQPSFCWGWSHSRAELPCERKTGGDAALSIWTSKVPCELVLSALRLPCSSPPSLGNMWQKMMLHPSALPPAEESHCFVLSSHCALALPLSDSMLRF